MFDKPYDYIDMKIVVIRLCYMPCITMSTYMLDSDCACTCDYMIYIYIYRYDIYIYICMYMHLYMTVHL